MRTLFSGERHVHYSQIYVKSGATPGEGGLRAAFAGQTNGICGAAVPGSLFLITGLHTGRVGFTIELHDETPPLDDAWEEIVEVSFMPETSEVILIEWGGAAYELLALEQVEYRVRYCGTGRDEARKRDTRIDGEPQLDRYLLQFWPSPARPDQVVRQTSANAAYWHRHARGLPPPPSPEEKAEAERRAQAEAQRVRQERQRHDEARRWGGRLPTERLRNVRGNVFGMVSLDPDLVHAIGDAPAQTQRKIARWAAWRAYQRAGLAELDWTAPALAALDRGEPLPPPFTDDTEVWQRFHADEQMPRTLVTSLDGRHHDMLQQGMAVPALFGAAEADPLQAALDALFAAAVTFGRDHYRELLDEVRRTFLVD
ncbi:hypothetical protein GCM10027290_55270 [Micromonospora sonneratiae]|uniref:Uncharacterized protein n=1 Tax=Micromonospora sonneratiae TaxID=1184706 RepID=A0ABW3YAT8_9ACTN